MYFIPFYICREGKIEEALSFAQTKLSEAGENIPEALNELERTLALLAFEKPQLSPFGDLLEQSYRQKASLVYHRFILLLSILNFRSPAS